MRKALVILLLAGSAFAATPAPQVEVSLEIWKDGKIMPSPKVALGEPFEVVVKVRAASDVDVSIPASWQTGSFELLTPSNVTQPAGGLSEHVYRFPAYAWQVGEQTFPPVPVTYGADNDRQQAFTDAIKFQVTSLIGDKEVDDATLRPAAPPVKVTERDWRLTWGVAGAGAALVVFAAVLLVRRLARRRRKRWGQAKPEVGRPPQEIALAKLQGLASLVGAEDPRPLYFGMSEALREYLGARFGFEALELTTAELLATLARVDRATADDDMAGWLDGCDLVKYAGRKVPEDEAAAALEQAIGFVTKLSTPAPAPVVPTVSSPPVGPVAAARTGTDHG